MTKLKKILALLLVAALCVCLLAACAKSDKNEAPKDESKPAETPAEAPAESEEHDLVEITMYGMANHPADRVAEVEKAVNAIIEQKIGVHLNMKFFEFGQYNTQLNMAISGGETVDLANFDPLPGGALSTLVANTQAMDIKDLLYQYGPDIIKEIEPYLGAYTYGNGVYGLPALRQKASSQGMVFNAAMARELGVEDAINNARTWADLEAVYDVVRDNLNGVYANGGSLYMTASAYFFLDPVNIASVPFDSLGDQMYLVYGDENGKVANLYENENWLDQLRMFARWYEAGYIYPDTPYNTEISGNDLLKNTICFSGFTAGEVGGKATLESMIGFELIDKHVGQGNLTTTVMTVWGNFIPATAKEPAAAIKFLNELYVNSELMDLMCWGIEGVDYVVNDIGEACYPEGVDVSSVYHYSEWMIGNTFILKPWEGNGEGWRELCRQDLANSTVSPYMGFTLDTGNMTNLMGGLSSVAAEYRASMEGGLYTDALCAEYMNKLASAEFQNYMDQIQAQLDAWK